MTERSSELSDALVNWLEDATPNDWHRVAIDYNWDSSLAPLQWIVEQKQCDRATAMLIFWQSEPLDGLDEPDVHDPSRWDAERVKLVTHLSERFNMGTFERSRIAFRIPTYLFDHLDDYRSEEHRHSPVKFHKKMILPSFGMAISPDAAFYERYPEQFRQSHIGLDAAGRWEMIKLVFVENLKSLRLRLLFSLAWHMKNQDR